MKDEIGANGAAKPEDFKKRAEECNPPERVVLPKSGLAVLLRRPNALKALLISNELGKIPALDDATVEERQQFIALLMDSVNSVLVSPRLSLLPGRGEIDPNWLPEEDAQFLINWGLGVPRTRDTQRFPGGSGVGAQGGAGGGDVALPPERPPAESR